MPTGYKLYQEYQTITRIPNPGFLCRAGLTCFKAESSSPIQLPIFPLIHCPSVPQSTMKAGELAQGRHPGCWFYTVGSGSFTSRPGSPSWLPDTSKYGIMEVPWTHSHLSTPTLSSLPSMTQEKRDQVGRITKERLLRWQDGGKHNRKRKHQSTKNLKLVQVRSPTQLHVLQLNGRAIPFWFGKADERIFGCRDRLIINTEEQPMQGSPPPTESSSFTPLALLHVLDSCLMKGSQPRKSKARHRLQTCD